MRLKRFSDFAKEEKRLDGQKVKIESILNQKIFITGCNVKKSKYDKNNSGKYLIIQFKNLPSENLPSKNLPSENLPSEKKVFLTGSDVLIDQIEKYKHEIPFLVTIKKIDRYYTFA